MQLVDDAPIANSQPVAIASLQLGHVVVTGVRIGGDGFDLPQNPLLPVHWKPGKGFGKGFCSDDLVHQSIVTVGNNDSQPENLGRLLFSSHFSRTAITDTESQSRNNSPTVQHRKRCPSPETDPSSTAKHLRRLFDKRTTKQQKRPPCTPKSARQTAASPAKSLFM